MTNSNPKNNQLPSAYTVTVAHAGNVMDYPPVISLLTNLLVNGHTVYLVSSAQKKMLPSFISGHAGFHYYYVADVMKENDLRAKIERNTVFKDTFRRAVRQAMKKADILWTTTDVTVKTLGDIVLRYTHVMQLMELIEGIPRFGHLQKIQVPIDRYARAAAKVVVPEINRAYIQRTWWNLREVPVVLPNKPYPMDPGEPTPEMKEPLRRLREEKRKVLLYTGVVGPDRSIEPFAKAIQGREEYCLYMIGKQAFGCEGYLDQLRRECPNIVYLGYYQPPKHLLFLDGAYIGLMPYKAQKSQHYSVLNALYCAPNKLYEYAGHGLPMIGTDVMGLRLPYEKYQIGICCEDLSAASISRAIGLIEDHYEMMSTNCRRFDEDCNLDEIVEEILSSCMGQAAKRR